MSMLTAGHSRALTNPAGVDIVGMSSLVTFLENTSPYRRATREREYGSLENDRDFLTRASPLTRIDDIRAPLFVIHGANDPRVPVTEASQLHAALTAKGIPCELRIYGDEGHGLAQRANRIDAYPAAFEFLAQYIAPRGYATHRRYLAGVAALSTSGGCGDARN
jgi:dipeptidyl aminopeptidase/acylaminoacyl peptidase